MKKYGVITTINPPNIATRHLREHLSLVVIGYTKTQSWTTNDYYSVDRQENLGFALYSYVPNNHYSRKNFGYLLAMRNGAEVIYDTDDDNFPRQNWAVRTESKPECYIVRREGWCNVYSYVNAGIWPRGFSLKHTNTQPSWLYNYDKVNSPIQQGLADNDPDVDAIWRLLMRREVSFKDNKSIFLGKNTWCPFNSQSTWWWPVAYPLMYLPVHAPFRMTDIWRSFVAQRCLWEVNMGVTFHSPSEVYQDRNDHDLIKDLEDEMPGYINNDRIVEALTNLTLKRGVENICDNMLTCYMELINIGVLPNKEQGAVLAWLTDYKSTYQQP